MFFKEMCAGGQEYMSESRYDTECSDEAIAEGGIGSDDADQYVACFERVEENIKLTTVI